VSAAVSIEMLRWCDYVGVFVFALSGASLAARKQMDLVGVLVLAGVTGLGGGMVRDVLIDESPPLALRSPIPLLLPAAATIVVMAAHSAVVRVERQVLVFDAAGLSLFAVTGAVRTLDAGLGWWAAILLGATSAVGGGVLRDVLARDVPLVFRAESGLYAIPAALAATAATIAHRGNGLGPVPLVAIIVVAFGFRIAALRRQWTAPHPRRRA
jgi:uncharacterized membrane protein YeiH